MKYFSLLLVAFLLASCSKEKSENGFRDGQEVNLLVNHRYGSIQDEPALLPQNKPLSYSLREFKDRKPGYIYSVRAKFKKLAQPLQDGPSAWFELVKVINEERYNGNESFDILLIQSFVPGGPFISLNKIDDHYQYNSVDVTLTPVNQTVKDQLAELWKNKQEIITSWEKDKKILYPKWRLAKATVTHDPNNFGKAYLIQKIEFIPL